MQMRGKEQQRPSYMKATYFVDTLYHSNTFWTPQCQVMWNSNDDDDDDDKY